MRGLRTVTGAVMVCASMAACNALTGISDLSVNTSPLDSPDAYLLPASDGGAVVADASYGGFDATTISDASIDTGKPDATTKIPDASPDASPVPDASPGDPGPCVTATIGPNYGKDVAQGTGWTSRAGLLLPGDDLAARSNGSTVTIAARNFGFVLPATAQILGITVEIGRSSEADPAGGLSTISDGSIALPKGDPKKNGPWPAGSANGPFPNSTYGSPADTWGGAWTAADLNATTFGVAIKPEGTGLGYVDSVGVTVTYCVIALH